jgi:hypothetical protein
LKAGGKSGSRLGKTNGCGKAENHQPENKNGLFHIHLLCAFIPALVNFQYSNKQRPGIKGPALPV